MCELHDAITCSMMQSHAVWWNLGPACVWSYPLMHHRSNNNSTDLSPKQYICTYQDQDPECDLPHTPPSGYTAHAGGTTVVSHVQCTYVYIYNIAIIVHSTGGTEAHLQ